MKRALIVLTALSSGLVLTNCNSNNNAPATQAGSQAGPAWSVSLKTQCADGAAETCVGFYGFSVTADHEYIVGPGPAGQKLTGRLSDDEFASISKLVNGDSASNTTALAADRAQTCDTSEEVITSNTEDQVTFKRGSQNQSVLTASADKVCYQTATADQAKALHSAITALANTYYLTPFPNKCSDAAAAFEATYAAVQHCSADSECSYFNSAFDVASNDETVWADNCAVIHPLAVGNQSAVLGAKQKLIQGLTDVENACQDQGMNRANCTQYRSFAPSEGAAVCDKQQHVCRINPSIQL